VDRDYRFTAGFRVRSESAHHDDCRSCQLASRLITALTPTLHPTGLARLPRIRSLRWLIDTLDFEIDLFAGAPLHCRLTAHVDAI
jgi:hypothetical protein